MPILVASLNHAVLYVRDATRAAEFYAGVFGFEVVESAFGGRAVFMRASGGDNHHDLGLFSVGPDAPRAPRGSTGLYHLAWEVPTIEDLADAARVLSEAGALGGTSDHGVSKSLYGADPDGNEFEILWRVPREAWASTRTGAWSCRSISMPRSVAGERPERPERLEPSPSLREVPASPGPAAGRPPGPRAGHPWCHRIQGDIHG